jgi:hypothetical protein
MAYAAFHTEFVDVDLALISARFVLLCQMPGCTNAMETAMQLAR